MKLQTPRALAMLAATALVLVPVRLAQAMTCTMTADSTSDGTFTVVTESGQTVNQATGSPGSYAGFMYFQPPSGCTFASGATLYAEIDYLDVSGEPPDASVSGGVGNDSGNLGLQYDAQSTLGNAFQNAAFVINGAILGTAQLKTAVSRLDDASFALDENGGNDLRLVQAGTFQLNVVAVRLSDQPTALYTQDTAFLGPYTGPTYAGGTPVDATTLEGKLVCGYQGWYGTPGDTDNLGWSHWSTSEFSLTTSTLELDPWPDLSEFTPAEQFPIPGLTYPDGGTALLFSSDVARTVLRHFQWMEAWGIDGVGLQRFVASVPSLALDRVLTDVRLAANETGRVYYVEYDMSGIAEADLVATMTTDWHYLVDTLNVTSDSRYLHHGGLPVIGIFGFYPNRFSSATASAVLDIFGTAGSYQAFVEGAGDWSWRTNTTQWTADWLAVLYKMGAWQPWDVGNTTSTSPNYAATGFWSADQAQLQGHNVLYVPEVYAGSSSVNRDMTPPGSGLPRLAGGVLWNEFTVATSIGAKSVFLGMFDEVTEGTQVLKVTNSPPTQAPNTVTYEGMPSDAYLCFTSQGSKMLKGLTDASAPLPDCPAMTQPTIPDPIAPLDSAVVSGPSVGLSWSAAMALAGGGSLTSYETWVDGAVNGTSSLSLDAATTLAPGTHVWRVRAVNSLGNSGGWSVAQTFSVGSSSLDAGTSSDGGAPDGGASPNDAGGGAGVGLDASSSSSSSPSSSGCACSESAPRGARSEGFATWAALGLALGCARRRRRPRTGGSPRRSDLD